MAAAAVDNGVASNPTVEVVAKAVVSNREDMAAKVAKLQPTTSNSREAPVASGNNRARGLSLGFTVVPLLRCGSISKMH